MKFRFFLVIISFLPFYGICQREANIWYFGRNAGLDFNSGIPVALEDGQLSTLEGCASISDSSGDLLFYTDGVTVWNKNHTIMNNGTGLNGHPSSTQSAIIVPKPESLDIYYIFTVDESSGNKGLQYSEVDMTLDSGLGGITSNKNILLISPTMEKVTAVNHANGKDIWVITHQRATSVFNAYLVKNSGVQTSPIASDVGFVSDAYSTWGSHGYMKCSPDGLRLGVAYGGTMTNSLQIFDFDITTGKVSNPVDIYGGLGKYIYGLEFSISGDILYVSGSSDGILQYDITSGNAADIFATELLIEPAPSIGNWGALQMATDGKIYIARPNANFLSVINNPEVLGTACDFQNDAVSLGTGSSVVGLPPFIQSFFIAKIQAKNTCFGQNTNFQANISTSFDAVLWDFGDGSTSTTKNPTHTYSSPGIYTVTLTVTSGTEVTTDTIDIIIYDQPIANQPPDIDLCDFDNDGFTSFDLTTQNDIVLNGQSNTTFNISYYGSMNDYTNNNPINNPNSYTNINAFISQTIIASIRNANNYECESITSFKIQVFKVPTPSQTIPDLLFCDNTSIGSDSDGIVQMDLTQNEAVILNGESAADFSLLYYTDIGLTNQITNPRMYQNTAVSETIFVQIVNSSNTTCMAQTSFNIEIIELPMINTVVELKQCDDDLDGFSVFNLNEVIYKITSNASNEIITFYESQMDAQNNNNSINDPIVYTNQVVSADTIWARIENANGCFRISQVNLIVSTTQIPNTFTRDFYKCDDNMDGITSFDFSIVNNQILALFPVGQQLIIKYFRNQADALSEQNPITDISNYRNTGYPNTQHIFIRVDNMLNNDCIGLGHHITLHVETVPVANPVIIAEQCDDDGDNMYAFDTSAIETTLLNGQTDINIIYTDEKGVLLSSPLPNPFITQTQTINARLINKNSLNTGDPCFDETTITFSVDVAAVAHFVQDMVTCDDDADGVFAFDTSHIETTVLNNQNGMMVSYFNDNGVELESPLPNPFLSGSQTITIRVENPLSIICFDETSFEFVVNEQPVLLMQDVWSICRNDTVEIIADTGFDEYIWSTGEMTQTISVDKAGTYELTVANVNRGVRCEATKRITVVESTVATIIDFEIRDWTQNNNSIKVFVKGDGDYEYSVDGINYQDSSEFYNLLTGDYLIYVRDKKGCGVVTKEVYLLHYPNFFTPNGDGYHDNWQIINSEKEPNNKIYIFNRIGKLLKQLKPSDLGWDGTYNGSQVPSGEYWFLVERENGKSYKGHFSLIR